MVIAGGLPGRRAPRAADDASTEPAMVIAGGPTNCGPMISWQ